MGDAKLTQIKVTSGSAFIYRAFFLHHHLQNITLEPHTCPKQTKNPIQLHERQNMSLKTKQRAPEREQTVGLDASWEL